MPVPPPSAQPVTHSLDVSAGTTTTAKTVNQGSIGIFDYIQSIQLQEVIIKAVAYAIIISVFLSVVFIFVGGVSFILSGGQEEKIKQAVSTIRYAIFGLVISVLAVVIVATVGKALGLDDFVSYIDLGEVYDMVRGIGSSGNSPTSGTESLE